MRKLAKKQRRLNPIKENGRKRKFKEDEVADIKWQKLSLEWSVKYMQADVDNYLTPAEENNILYLVRVMFLEKLFRKRKTALKILTKQLENWSAS